MVKHNYQIDLDPVTSGFGIVNIGFPTKAV